MQIIQPYLGSLMLSDLYLADVASIDGYFADRANFGCPPMPCVRRQVRVLPFCAHDVLGSIPPENYIAPDLSQFDDEIPEADYKSFMAYLKNNPSPNAEGERRSSVHPPTIPQGPTANDHFSEALRTETPSSKTAVKISSNPSSRTESPPPQREAASEPEPFIPVETPLKTEVLTERDGHFVQAVSKEEDKSDGESVGSRCFGRRSGTLSKEVNDGNEAAPAIEGEADWGFWGMSTKSFLSSFLHAISPGTSKTSLERSALTPTQITSYSGVSGKRGSKLARRHSDLPISEFSWRTLIHYALNPTESDHTVRELYDLGRADAFRWVQLQVRRGEEPSGEVKVTTTS